MNEDLIRDFKGVWIPKNVWLDERLTALEKVILVEIDSLSQDDDGCYASNEYIAKFCQCSERKVSDSITRLKKLGYLEITKFDGRKRYLRSRLTETSTETRKKCEADSQNLLHINIDNNIDNKEYIETCITEIIKYLNKKTNKSFRTEIKNNREFIRARLKDGYKIKDFKYVIDVKSKEWLNTEMDQWLNPQTLFRPKNFERYLNQKNTSKDESKQQEIEVTW